MSWFSQQSWRKGQAVPHLRSHAHGTDDDNITTPQQVM